jgi:hypothetical protein
MYQLYLLRLQTNGLHDRVIAACRRIRSYAARGPGLRAGLFTFHFELDSLVARQNYQAAWRQLQLRDAIARGRCVPMERRRWSAKDRWELAYSYAPLLYFLDRVPLGCKLLEMSLGFWLRGTKRRSYDILFHVYNGEDRPRVLPRVTLAHFYRRLGKDLKQWRHWPAFVNGFSPQLFGIAGIERRALLEDPAKLGVFFASLMQVRDKRVTSGVTRGQADLTESSAKVKKWQDGTAARIQRHRSEPARERTKEALLEHFPELQALAR